MLKVYKCITTCTWDGRYWEEGALTRPLPPDKEPPEHFEEVQDQSELKEVLNTIDEEEEADTYAQFAQQINDTYNTGVGIMAGDDLQLKSLAQLKEIAKRKGVYKSELRTKEALIEAIESAEEGE